MKVTQHIASAKRPLISFEILPPVKGKSIEHVYKNLDPLMELGPSFINVTYHRAEQIFKEQTDGSFRRVEIRKRPGTVGICAALMNRYKVDAIPHLICGGFTKEETENALIDLHYLGIHNVLALRGDPPGNEKFFTPYLNGNSYAVDLVRQIDNMNQGAYLESEMVDAQKTDFCIGVAGYPEKHYESANMDLDLGYLDQKIKAGAEYITTQMFFDNKKFFDFKARCQEIGVNVPIIPGLKPVTHKKQLRVLPSIFNVDLPQELTTEMLKCKTEEDSERVGAEWLLAQCKELIEKGAPVLHFYTMGKPEVIYKVVKELI